MPPDLDLDPKLVSKLRALQATPTRSPQLASRARTSFLVEAARLAPSSHSQPQTRQGGWNEALKNLWFFRQKGKNALLNFAITILLTFALLIGSGVTAVAAAQSAQPEDVLYPVKTWSEDVRLDWEHNPQSRLDLTLQFTDRRIAEIQASLAVNGTIPEPVLARLQSEQEQTLALAAGLPAPQVLPALTQVRNRARQQDQALSDMQLPNSHAAQYLARVETMLQNQAQLAQQGMDNPEALRQRLRNGDYSQPGTNIPAGTSTPCNGNGSGYGPVRSQTPQVDSTPIPGSGYRYGSSKTPPADITSNPGSEPQGSSTPKAGNGPGPQPASGSGGGKGGKP